MAPESAPRSVKYKVLCLHGIGTNSEILEAQTAALRYELGDDYQYDFIDGSYPWPVARGIGEVFGDRQICYSYVDGSTESVVKAVNDLAEYVTDNGPFDAVMGFSLGAALAATLLLRNEKQRATLQNGPAQDKRAFKCAIFLCGTLPCDWHELERGKMRLLRAKDASNLIPIPTAHAWSSDDVDYPGQSAQLAHMCESTKRVDVIHSAGHGVPSHGDELLNVVNAIQKTMSSLEL